MAARFLSDAQLERLRGFPEIGQDELVRFFANHGSIRRHRLHEQSEQAWCLTVLTNAVVTWTTEYYSLATQTLRATGRHIPNEVLAHISPAHSANINFFGIITLDVDAELAKLDSQGLRPLRNP